MRLDSADIEMQKRNRASKRKLRCRVVKYHFGNEASVWLVYTYVYNIQVFVRFRKIS